MDYFNQFVSKVISNQHVILENFIFSVGPLAALIAARYGYKTFLKLELFSSLMYAVVFLFRPQCYTNIALNSALKPYHQYLCALFGIYVINYIVLYLFFMRNSQDKGVYYGHQWFHIIFSTLTIIDNIIVYFEGVHWNYKILCFVTSFAFVNLFINAYFLSRSIKPNGVLEDHANQIAKLDFFLLFACGIFIYAFPDHFCIGLRVSNESYRSMARSIGAIVTSAAFQSFFVSDFIFVSDKKTFLLVRLIGNFLELVVILSGHYWFNVLSIMPSFCWFVSLNLVYTALILYGYLVTPTGEQKEKTN